MGLRLRSQPGHDGDHGLARDRPYDSTNPGQSVNLAAPALLDLYRFSDTPEGNPETEEEFANPGRELRPGEPALFDDLSSEYPLSTAGTDVEGEDNPQASHWRDDLGFLMDPTLGFGQVVTIAPADIRALDLIGYEAAMVPLPPGGLLMGSAMVLLAWQRRSPAETNRKPPGEDSSADR